MQQLLEIGILWNHYRLLAVPQGQQHQLTSCYQRRPRRVESLVMECIEVSDTSNVTTTSDVGRAA